MKVNVKIPTASIICGFIGSGKTTFAKKLELETGALRITKDEWMVKIFGNIADTPSFHGYDTKVTELSRTIALQMLRQGVDIILDEGFWQKSQRDEMRKSIEKTGANAVLYYVRCPLDLMRKRTLERNRNPGESSFEITGEMFDSYIKFWDPPHIDENYILASDS
jgi:predicted kinase